MEIGKQLTLTFLRCNDKLTGSEAANCPITSTVKFCSLRQCSLPITKDSYLQNTLGGFHAGHVQLREYLVRSRTGVRSNRRQEYCNPRGRGWSLRRRV